ncbi:hypothetical protein MKZ23_11090 [Paenibacillus sp. FSL R5-0876]|uniref:hypothetical protein n=1 Tax=Paenibacillus sp. FSL R5-0876 TaxID=2921661 RepID=UPI0030F66686
MKEKSVFYHPGIYRFQWPYLAAWLSQNEQHEVTVYHCDVEIRVGQEEDMKVGKLVTVTVTAREHTPGVQNFITEIATKVRLSFFDQIFLEKHWGKTLVPEHRIRWIECHPYIEDQSPLQVSMKWDSKKHAYHSPAWKTFSKQTN